MKSFFASLIFFILIFPASGQTPEMDAAQIANELWKLKQIDRVLYIAAHPDDENTKIIAWAENSKYVSAAYLSLTRGEGGQNLIGRQTGALLGIIRTQELLNARKIDGGKQFFTRAIDFGYSKTADETFKHWNHDSVLSDVVRIIRKFKPNIIITRFPTDGYAGHGHHSASALLAIEAFSAAASENFFPESAKIYGTWQADAIYWNDSPWWTKDIEKHADDYTVINVGEWNALLGKSVTEIAAEARSQHKSQGFGAAVQRGSRNEYLKLNFLKANTPGFLSGYTNTWLAIDGGIEVQQKIESIIDQYDASYPSASVDPLMDLYFTIRRMPENPYKADAMERVKELIAACGGLWFEFRSETPYLVANEPFDFSLEAISQSRYPYKLKYIAVENDTFAPENELLGNSISTWKGKTKAPGKISQPWWLEALPQGDMYAASNRSMIGNPETPPAMTADFVLNTPYGYIHYQMPLVYKWTDPVKGELYRPAAVVNPVSLHFEHEVLIGTSGPLTIRVTANTDLENGATVTPVMPKGWKVSPQSATTGAMKKGEVKNLVFRIETAKPVTAEIFAEAKLNGVAYDRDLVEVSALNIETTVVQPVAKTKVINEPIATTPKKVGYLMGPGDDVPEALLAMGYDVTLLDPRNTDRQTLTKYDVIITGIRAYNTVPELATLQPLLLEFVENGGTLIVQYNTNRHLVVNNPGPYPMEISRERVTEENAPATMLNPEHPVWNRPNKITLKDFDGWVQERGLYFAGNWSPKYTPLIAWNDTGENKKLKGALLVTPYGKGHFVYTGISFFRQLPAGVPGAYRLFSNIISL